MKKVSPPHADSAPAALVEAQRAQAHAQALAAAMPFNPGKAIELGRANAVSPPRGAAPAEIAPQFELAYSGWYWQITRLDSSPPDIRASKSLFATQLPRLVAGSPGHGVVLSGYAFGPGGGSR